MSATNTINANNWAGYLYLRWPKIVNRLAGITATWYKRISVSFVTSKILSVRIYSNAMFELRHCFVFLFSFSARRHFVIVFASPPPLLPSLYPPYLGWSSLSWSVSHRLKFITGMRQAIASQYKGPSKIVKKSVVEFIQQPRQHRKSRRRTFKKMACAQHFFFPWCRRFIFPNVSIIHTCLAISGRQTTDKAMKDISRHSLTGLGSKLYFTKRKPRSRWCAFILFLCTKHVR